MILLEDFILTSQIMKYILRKKNKKKRKKTLSNHHPPSNNFMHVRPSKLLYTHSYINKHTNNIRLQFQVQIKFYSNKYIILGSYVRLLWHNIEFKPQEYYCCWQLYLFNDKPLLEDHRKYIPAKPGVFTVTLVWKCTN